MSLDAEYQQAHLNVLRQQLAIQEAEQREREMEKAKADLFMNAYTGKL